MEHNYRVEAAGCFARLQRLEFEIFLIAPSLQSQSDRLLL